MLTSPSLVIRGPVVLLRSEPPSFNTGNAAVGMARGTDQSQWTQQLGVEEVKETLRFYQQPGSASPQSTEFGLASVCS